MIEVGPDLNPNVLCGTLPRWRIILNSILRHVWYYRLRRWIPRLVWIDDELDVCVTFTEDKINLENPVGSLFSGGIYDLQSRFNRMGIYFDSGCGSYGRDWEWDWSLKGPISVKFRGRAKHPEKRVRKEIPKPRLVV
jgi:hypothetical protein